MRIPSVASVRSALLVLIGFIAPVAGAQSAGVDAPREIYATRRDEYTAEARELRATSGRVTRRAGKLVIRLASGRIVTLADTLANADHFHRFVYLKFLPARAVHVVATSFYEGGTYHVIHDRSGQDVTVPAEPLWSPDSAHFAIASSDLEAGYSPNVLELWRVDGRGLTRAYVLDGGDQWGPEEVRWLSRDRLSFVRMTLRARDGQTRVPPQQLQFTQGRWVLRASGR
ncbi:hypothetical protein [Gemmatimonas groenlandica]|uniref:Uncharacterized protein n=1 Tax=Gemmatimonas groenlandica TaxID=2732249 RepID=A0A6M4ISM9_9BACT|nr:hypothetical protein [Gemmatimonas groenlandica]QJR37185.1 hypothetical protein HKW67_17510 [Gemmatimonas groenlandica]